MSIIISKGGRDARKVEQSGVKDEGFLQRYVSDNPDSLPLDEVKDDARLMVIGREFPTRSGPIDVLAVDRDGDLYIIETKLYKNPDKRLVVAQVLDYGASLWKGYPDPDKFLSDVEAALARAGRAGLSQNLRTLYGFNDEEAQAAVQSAKRNLADGSIKFVVLMDRLHDYLRDLILFINEKSRFDIYAVEMEFYRHGELEIVIPKLFGAEVRKEVSTGASAGGSRRRWDEASFFADAKARLKLEELSAVRRLFEFAEAGADEVSWGTGAVRGSFNPKYLKASPRSLFSVFSDGTLQLNFGWLGRTGNEKRFRDQLKAELDAAKLFDLPAEYAEEYIPVSVKEWAPRLEDFTAAVRRLLERN